MVTASNKLEYHHDVMRLGCFGLGKHEFPSQTYAHLAWFYVEVKRVVRIENADKILV